MRKIMNKTKKFIAVLLVSAIAFTPNGFTQQFSHKVQAKTVSLNNQVAKVETNNTQATTTKETSKDTVLYATGDNDNDFRDETIYFVMTTRFYDGDTSNNVHCWDGVNADGDPAWRGDFKGLIEKLDYIKALGFTAIWITPIVKNASGYDYHGYHAINFSEVDARYESDDCTYQDLIDAVHAKGMKIIQDVVFNHTGNFGEENLLPIFNKDESEDLGDMDACLKIATNQLPINYGSLTPGEQYAARLALMKNTDGVNHDVNNLYHHQSALSWESYSVQTGQIAGDCVDLNTENPKTYKYIRNAYDKYIEMGVDAFRIDTVKHISRLTFNNAFNNHFNDTYNRVNGTSGEKNFFMFGEVCTRYRDVWNSGIPAISSPFYTWKESKNYPWNDSENDPNAYLQNETQTELNYGDNSTTANQPTSNNAFLNGNSYRTPDYSKHSGLDVIDFPMHWSFTNANDAFNIAKSGDKYYNDATFNVTYVDSHDYAPDGAPENARFDQPQSTWAENLSLMWTFRGIPCLYYGSEVEFQKGKVIDNGPNTALANTGRAYFGDYIEGNVDVTDFGSYTNASGTMASTLNHPLSLHIQRLNRIRAAVPALRKGQYSTEGCSGPMSFKRRYTDSTTDSYALVTVSSSSTFTGILNGTYVDAITGDTKVVTNNTLTASCSKKGDLRVYVLNTSLTPAPGMIAGWSSYLSGGKDVVVNPIGVTSVSLTPSTSTLDYGDTVTLKATVAPSNATNKSLTFTSSNPSVATVSNSGKVTAKGLGTTTITAKASNGVSGTAKITVDLTGIRVTSVTLDKTSAQMEIGDSLTLTSTVLPANTDYPTLTWTSSNPSVATVKDGVVTAITDGTVTITATSVNGISASATITVNPFQYTPGYMYFEKPSNWGASIKAYIWSADQTYKNGAWPGVAATKFTSNVYGIPYPSGMTNLKVIFNDGSNQTADLAATNNGYYTKSGLDHVLTFNQVNPTGVTLDKTSANVAIGATTTLTATVLPSDATNKTVTWTTSNSSVATVSNGVVTGVGVGTATITATTSNGLKTTATVTVSNIPVTSIKLSASTLSVNTGSTATITATVLPSNATNSTVTWTTSNSSVATVSNGVVTGVASGTATITATTSNGLKATATVTVKDVAVTSITLSQSNATVPVGTTTTLTATVSPSNASNKTVTWTTSNASVATVSNGVVTGVGEGTATITAATSNGLTAKATITVTKVTTSYMYFSKPSNWGTTVYAYIWNDAITYKNSAWPGVAATMQSDGTYAIEWPKDYTGTDLNVIFNDGSRQTADLDAVKNGYYTSSGFSHIVSNVAPTGITLDKTTASVEAGSTVTLTKTVTPSDAISTVTWSTSNASVATVSNGVVTGVAAGTATITATTSNGLTATATITVTAATKTYMYFTKPANWGSTIYAYIWTNNGTYRNAAWPGVVTEYSNGYYRVEYPKGYTGLKIIFNDGSRQTADLDAVSGKYYSVN